MTIQGRRTAAVCESLVLYAYVLELLCQPYALWRRAGRGYVVTLEISLMLVWTMSEARLQPYAGKVAVVLLLYHGDHKRQRQGTRKMPDRSSP